MKRLRVLVAIVLLVACAPAVVLRPQPSPVPDPKALEAVRADRVVLDGFAEPHTPSEFNKAIFVRYRAASASNPRAVIVLMPGILGGAMNFDRLARTVIAQDATLEVWAVDRRANLLEDHVKLQEAFAQRDPLIAWRYFVRDAGTPQGFNPRPASSLGFMGFWGLETHLNDLRVVIETARQAAPKVILGGHSLGSVLVTMFAGWDFAGTTGASLIDGLVLMDGAPGNTLAANVTEEQYLEGFSGTFGLRTAGVKALESNQAAPYFDALGLNPMGLAKYSAAALLAMFDPQGDSPGGFVSYPASNLAAGLLGGAGGDNDYSPIPAFSISAGRADGATALNGIALLAGSGFRVQDITGPKPGARRVEWLPPQPGDEEYTDPTDFAARFWTPLADFQEWYFPARITLDIAAAGLEAPAWAVARGLRLTRLGEMRLPILTVAGGRGIVTDPKSFTALETKLGRKLEVKYIRGFTHLDMLAAVQNPFVGWLVEFSRGL